MAHCRWADPPSWTPHSAKTRPLFSFGLGLQPLQQVISTIEESAQEIGLHPHREWLTDPRCAGLPTFAGPLLSRYSERERFENLSS
jgi:hypothetical protein